MLSLHRADARAGDAVRTATDRVPGFDRTAVLTTDLGSMFMVVAAAASMVRRGQRRRAAEVVAAGTTAWTAAHFAKGLVHRPRPYEAEGTRRLIAPPTGSSMPSGHSAVVVSVMTVLRRRSRPDRRWPWPFVAAWVPMTRVHLGVHYPADTVVGGTLGLAIGRAVVAASDSLPGGPVRRG